MLNIDKNHIYQELEAIKQSLYNPFPYRDTDKIQNDFISEFSKADSLTADLNTYWMNIAGSLSYVLKGRANRMPQEQKDWLHLSFFEVFQQYSFFEESISIYPEFYREYINYEKTRKLLLTYQL
ncbi:YxiJ-like family protein [Peribacillus simplex]|uniref:YxiJ-like family protein n=1 Tax=Peribacillus simplex TaxID=1478 RepID=UPI0021AA9094|nr:YxiJ-like family protein [Peribacillus simplex]